MSEAELGGLDKPNRRSMRVFGTGATGFIGSAIVLINNAGIMRNLNLNLNLDRDLTDVTREIDINLSGPVRTVPWRCVCPCRAQQETYVGIGEVLTRSALAEHFYCRMQYDDVKTVAYRAVRVWLSDGTRMLAMWTGDKWWSTKGEIAPVKWELEVRQKKTDKLLKALRHSEEGQP